MNKTVATTALAAVLALAALAVVVGSAHATYPGATNGRIAFGINVGGGFEFALSGFDTFVEARFHSVFTDNSSTKFIPISFGIKF